MTNLISLQTQKVQNAHIQFLQLKEAQEPTFHKNAFQEMEIGPEGPAQARDAYTLIPWRALFVQNEFLDPLSVAKIACVRFEFFEFVTKLDLWYSSILT